MDYAFNNDILILDIPKRNRLLFRRDELLFIKEEGRMNDIQPHCKIYLKNGREYTYGCSMDDILQNIKPFL